MSWFEIASLVIVGCWAVLGLLIGVTLLLLIGWYKRAERRDLEVMLYRRYAGISLPREYEHRHWVNLRR